MHLICRVEIVVKGQIISKANYGILNSSKKRTNKFDFTVMIPQINFFLFVIVGGKLRHQKDIFKLTDL